MYVYYCQFATFFPEMTLQANECERFSHFLKFLMNLSRVRLLN